ncbi:MAG: histidine phosphatase family protein [Kiritimatiellae bacterium]|nr:histidine phosphatase family protein [Kiritimatiellia bacterium]
MATTFLLIRHGETAWNRGKIFRGAHDVPLNENGRRQARLVRDALQARAIDAAYTSPLSRAGETAAIVLAPHGVTPGICEGLLDFDYGDWTGKEDGEVARRWPAEHAAWTAKPHTLRVPGGDTLQAVFDRAYGAMEAAARTHTGQTVALFAHRVVNKLLVLGALGLGLDRFPFIIQGNCCINEFVRTGRGYEVHALNNTAHLQGPDVELIAADF